MPSSARNSAASASERPASSASIFPLEHDRRPAFGSRDLAHGRDERPRLDDLRLVHVSDIKHGFAVSRNDSARDRASSEPGAKLRAGGPPRARRSRRSRRIEMIAQLGNGAHLALELRRSACASSPRSASANSIATISKSRCGSGPPSTCVTSSILEAAHDHRDRVGLANVAQERVAEPFAAARAAHEPRDIDEADGRRDDALRSHEPAEPPSADRERRPRRRSGRSSRTDSSQRGLAPNG